MKFFKLKALLFLLGITYFLMVFSSVSDSWESALMGYEEARAPGQSAIYSFPVEPKGDVLNFGERILNQLTGEVENVRYGRMKVRLVNDPIYTGAIKFYNILSVLIVLLSWVILVYIPYRFYDIVVRVYRGDVFDNKTIKGFDKIGKALVILALSSTVFNYCQYAIDSSLFQFENYKIVRESADYMWLMVGLVCMIISRFLMKGLEMKEENELTV